MGLNLRSHKGGIVLVAFAMFLGSGVKLPGQEGCSSNPVVCENALTGNSEAIGMLGVAAIDHPGVFHRYQC